MILGIDATVDYAFKHLFGRESTAPILIDVIDSVLDTLPNRRIREIELLNPFNPKEALDDKLSILDIKARDQSGRQFNVEMQMVATGTYNKRILYYGCKLHQQQLHEGMDYAELRPTISISFLNDVLFPNRPSYHHCFGLLEKTQHFPLTGDIEFHILELPKFTKTAEELRTGLDIWLYFLAHAAMIDTDQLPAALQQPLVIRAVEELKVLTQSDLERERYESRRKAQLDHNAYLRDLKDARLEARQQGRQEGLQQGEKIGLIQFCERLLGRSETPVEQLTVLSLDDLTRLADELQGQALKQR